MASQPASWLNVKIGKTQATTNGYENRLLKCPVFVKPSKNSGYLKPEHLKTGPSEDAKTGIWVWILDAIQKPEHWASALFWAIQCTVFYNQTHIHL